MSFIVFSIDFLGNEFQVIVEAEDAADEQESLGHIDQQTIADIVNHHDLISHKRDATHDEQHRTSVLRDFKSRVFHGKFLLVHLTMEKLLKIKFKINQNHFIQFWFKFC